MLTRLAMLAVVGAAVVALGDVEASSYTVPSVALIEGTIPLSAITPETHILCTTRLDLDGNDVDSRSVCYSGYKPDAAPTLPIADEDLALTFHQVVPGAVVPSTGALFLVYANCTEFLPGYLAAEASFAFQLDKDEGIADGQIAVSADDTPDFDCGDAVTESDDATLEPLEITDDTDGDGCTDYKELGDDEEQGGLRDPFNPWDFFDVTGIGGVPDGAIRVNDVLYVVQAYFTDDPAANREIIGPNPWNLGPGPDGTVVTVSDILAVVNQYFHCH